MGPTAVLMPLLARCSGPQAAPKHRGVNEAESVTRLLGDQELYVVRSWAWTSP